MISQDLISNNKNSGLLFEFGLNQSDGMQMRHSAVPNAASVLTKPYV